MDFNKLNQILNEAEYSYADIDVEGLYNTIKPESFGTITWDEVDKVKQFLDLENKTDEELTAIRNTIVRHWSDQIETLRDEAEKEWNELKAKDPNADFSEFRKTNKYDVMSDQMSAFTHVIDSILWDRQHK